MSDLLSVLIDLFWLPYNMWKDTTESSRVGVSPNEKKTLRFWYAIAMSATLVIVVVALLGALVFHWLIG